MDSVFIVVPRTQFCVYCGAQDMFSVYCGAQDTILYLFWHPGHDSMWHPGHDSVFIVVPRCITLLPDMILCLLWCPGCHSVFIIVPRKCVCFPCGAQNTILCWLWCPGHDFGFIVVPLTWFLFIAVPRTWFWVYCGAHDLISVYCCAQDMLEGSQGQYIQLEKKLKVDFGALEKKYHKAKKLIKEYQQRSVSMHSQVCIGSFVRKSPVCHQAGWAHGKSEATVPHGCFPSEWQVLCLDIYGNFFSFELQVLCNDIHSKAGKPEGETWRKQYHTVFFLLSDEFFVLTSTYPFFLPSDEFLVLTSTEAFFLLSDEFFVLTSTETFFLSDKFFVLTSTETFFLLSDEFFVLTYIHNNLLSSEWWVHSSLRRK